MKNGFSSAFSRDLAIFQFGTVELSCSFPITHDPHIFCVPIANALSHIYIFFSKDEEANRYAYNTGSFLRSSSISQGTILR